MIKRILLGLVAIIACVLLVGAFQSNTYHIERSIGIAAPASTIFPHLNDLRATQAWSPWVKLDPAAKVTFSGPASGVGASNSWAGSSDVGEGRQTIIDSTSNKSVKLKLEFLKPMEDTAMAEFQLTHVAGDPNTTVTWSMSGHKNYVSKVMCMFMNMDKMVGGEFEKGLASLKKLVETQAKTD